MKVEHLKVGQVIKNYRELCGLLEVKTKTGGAKINQLKELEQYVIYHKEGNKFVIDEILNKEYKGREIGKTLSGKEDKRTMGNNNEQAKCIRYLLCNLLSNYHLEQDEVVGFSKGTLLRNLLMINDNYTTAKGRRKAYAQQMNVSKIAVDECIEYVDNRSVNAVKKAIQTLVNQKVIGYKYSYSWVDHKGTHHHCDITTHNIIMQAEFEVMENMNIRNKGKIYEFGRWIDFKDRVRYYLITNFGDIFENIDYYYSSFHFHYNNEQLKKHLNYMEEKQGINLQIATDNIQLLWSKSLSKTINNKHNKNSIGAWGEGFDEIEKYRRSTSYVEEQELIKNSITKQGYEIFKIDYSMDSVLDIDRI